MSTWALGAHFAGSTTQASIRKDDVPLLYLGRCYATPKDFNLRPVAERIAALLNATEPNNLLDTLRVAASMLEHPDVVPHVERMAIKGSVIAATLRRAADELKGD